MLPTVWSAGQDQSFGLTFSHLGHEVFRRTPNSPGKKVKFLNSQIDFAPFYLTHVTSIDASSVSKVLLGKPPTFPHSPEIFTKCSSDIAHRCLQSGGKTIPRLSLLCHGIYYPFNDNKFNFRPYYVAQSFHYRQDPLWNLDRIAKWAVHIPRIAGGVCVPLERRGNAAKSGIILDDIYAGLCFEISKPRTQSWETRGREPLFCRRAIS